MSNRRISAVTVGPSTSAKVLAGVVSGAAEADFDLHDVVREYLAREA